ncbi:hypothetical protein, partial [Streptomyces sp. P17]|uniref:hypothetical protein n=1 Tax=Streptomyces sp. P17 TaxID=3074716 RepID=UPI0028F45D4D
SRGTKFCPNVAKSGIIQDYLFIGQIQSTSGDFPEQVKTIHLSDIRDIWGDSHRIYMETNVGEIQLGPSNRKYKGRKTPIVSEYSSFPTFYKMLSKLIALD